MAIRRRELAHPPTSFEVEVLARLAKIEQLLLAANSSARDYFPADARDAERLAVIADSTKGKHFTSVELLTHARVDAALRAMLEGALVDLDRPKTCGRFLRQLEQFAMANNPIRLVRIGSCREGIVWAVHVSQVIPPPNSHG